MAGDKEMPIDPTEMSNAELAEQLRTESQTSIVHWNYSQLDYACEALARILEFIEAGRKPMSDTQAKATPSKAGFNLQPQTQNSPVPPEFINGNAGKSTLEPLESGA